MKKHVKMEKTITRFEYWHWKKHEFCQYKGPTSINNIDNKVSFGKNVNILNLNTLLVTKTFMHISSKNECI